MNEYFSEIHTIEMYRITLGLFLFFRERKTASVV
jgi:hypothetical protein